MTTIDGGGVSGSDDTHEPRLSALVGGILQRFLYRSPQPLPQPALVPGAEAAEGAEEAVVGGRVAPAEDAEAAEARLLRLPASRARLH